MCAVLSSSRIGDYAVLRTLGTGSTGKVKLGQHVHTGQLVALKIVPHSLVSRQPTLYKKIRREIAVLELIAQSCRRLCQQVDTPSVAIGVMQLLDVIHCPNSVVLVLEYCSGGELFDVLVDKGYFPESLVLDYFQQLVHALQFCHHHGVCHRDLKLENILLTDDGRLKIADFGLSTLHVPGSLLHTACGSPQYCAPEVLRGETYDGRIADMWSLGVILYAITTGGLPFNDDNFNRLYSQIRIAQFQIPDQVPPYIAHIIRSLLTPDPSQRATIADIKNTPWFQSKPPRNDVFTLTQSYIESCRNESPPPPVTDIDETVLRKVADLGMGDINVLRRRISSSRGVKERHLYKLLLDFSQHSISQRNAINEVNACSWSSPIPQPPWASSHFHPDLPLSVDPHSLEVSPHHASSVPSN